MTTRETTKETTRVSKKKLREYRQVLGDRDMAALRSVRLCRFLKTGQAARLHFGDAVTPSAGLRAATRALSRLHGMGLVRPLVRRIGGTRAGSTSYVWTARTAGLELLRMDENAGGDTGGPQAAEPGPQGTPRKRDFEPTYIFLKHTLTVAELYTRLATMDGIRLARAEFEPTCWRGFSTAFSANAALKPDFYAVTASGGYEDHWFFEVDLDTEAPIRIIRKCEVYGRYYLTGNEQRKNGIFPRVAWVVPDEKRRDALKRHIGEHLSGYAALFAVVTFDGFGALVSGGAGSAALDASCDETINGDENENVNEDENEDENDGKALPQDSGGPCGGTWDAEL